MYWTQMLYRYLPLASKEWEAKDSLSFRGDIVEGKVDDKPGLKVLAQVGEAVILSVEDGIVYVTAWLEFLICFPVWSNTWGTRVFAIELLGNTSRHEDPSLDSSCTASFKTNCFCQSSSVDYNQIRKIVKNHQITKVILLI